MPGKLRLHASMISVAGMDVNILELQIESRQYVFVYRMFPDGRFLRLRNYTVLIGETTLHMCWRGPYVKLLDEAFGKLRHLLQRYLDNPGPETLGQAQRVVTSFNETGQVHPH